MKMVALRVSLATDFHSCEYFIWNKKEPEKWLKREASRNQDNLPSFTREKFAAEDFPS